MGATKLCSCNDSVRNPRPGRRLTTENKKQNIINYLFNLYNSVTPNKATLNKGTLCLICLEISKLTNKAMCLI